jgi:hypothetical protein
MGFLAIGLEYLILDMYERLGRGPFLTALLYQGADPVAQEALLSR